MPSDQTAERALPDEAIQAAIRAATKALNAEANGNSLAIGRMHVDRTYTGLFGINGDAGDIAEFVIAAAAPLLVEAGRRQALDGARVEYAARWHGQIMGNFLGNATEDAVRDALDYADITDAEVVTRQVIETEWQPVQPETEASDE